jgi:hypothetical protein
LLQIFDEEEDIELDSLKIVSEEDKEQEKESAAS